MGVTLFDKQSNAIVFDVNFWHWRAIVEAVRRLGVLAPERIEGLHAPLVGELNADEAHAVAAAIRDRLLPTLDGAGERLLLDGRVTTEQDDFVMHTDPQNVHRNYSTSREVLEQFAAACATSSGFLVC